MRSHRVVAFLTILCFVASCGGSTDQTPPRISSYVAIGDSFVSGPGLPDQDPASPACQRSQRNYPSLLAKKLKVDQFTDVSCGGVGTGQVLGPVRGSSLSAQIDAVAADTDLVTVGIGGNDGSLYRGLYANCFLASTQTVNGCTDFTNIQTPRILATTQKSVAHVLTAVREAAPKARVLLVGYLRILPKSGPCQAIPVPAGQIALAAQAQQAIDAMLEGAAKSGGVPYLSLLKLSRGHDACAGDQAWVNGLHPTGDGAYLHPNTAGMRAVAKAVEAALVN